MGSALVYVVVVALVAGAVFLLVSMVFGRGEELAPMPPTATPTRLPARELSGADVRDLRFQQVVRGYKCSEVDWAMERLATEIDTLRARLDVVTDGGAAAAETESGDGNPTDPTPVDGQPARGEGESAWPTRGTTGADAGNRSWRH